MVVYADHLEHIIDYYAVHRESLTPSGKLPGGPGEFLIVHQYLGYKDPVAPERKRNYYRSYRDTVEKWYSQIVRELDHNHSNPPASGDDEDDPTPFFKELPTNQQLIDFLNQVRDSLRQSKLPEAADEESGPSDEMVLDALQNILDERNQIKQSQSTSTQPDDIAANFDSLDISPSRPRVSTFLSTLGLNRKTTTVATTPAIQLVEVSGDSPVLLRGGGRAELEDTEYWLTNTCGVDAFLQILYVMAFHNDNYRASAMNEAICGEIIPSVLRSLLENPDNQDVINAAKVKFVRNFPEIFKIKIMPATQRRLKPLHKYDCFHDVGELSSLMFTDYPSLRHECEAGGMSCATLPINASAMVGGHTSLQNPDNPKRTVKVNVIDASMVDLDSLLEAAIGQVTEDCHNTCIHCHQKLDRSNLKFGQHVIVDVLQDPKHRVTQYLGKFPRQPTRFPYLRLAGIIGFRGRGARGHYIAYCFERTGWYVYDDMKSHIFLPDKELQTAVRALVFINTQSDQ